MSDQAIAKRFLCGCVACDNEQKLALHERTNFKSRSTCYNHRVHARSSSLLGLGDAYFSPQLLRQQHEAALLGGEPSRQRDPDLREHDPQSSVANDPPGNSSQADEQDESPEQASVASSSEHGSDDEEVFDLGEFLFRYGLRPKLFRCCLGVPSGMGLVSQRKYTR